MKKKQFGGHAQGPYRVFQKSTWKFFIKRKSLPEPPTQLTRNLSIQRIMHPTTSKTRISRDLRGRSAKYMDTRWPPTANFNYKQIGTDRMLRQGNHAAIYWKNLWPNAFHPLNANQNIENECTVMETHDRATKRSKIPFPQSCDIERPPGLIDPETNAFSFAPTFNCFTKIHAQGIEIHSPMVNAPQSVR